MSTELVATIIFAFCAKSHKPIVYDKSVNQQLCWEQILNCTVDTKGNVNRDTLKKCLKKYEEKKGA